MTGRSHHIHTKKPFLTLLWMMFFAWFILCGWVGSIWIQHGFTRALDAILHLSMMQKNFILPFNIYVPSTHIPSFTLPAYLTPCWILLYAIGHLLLIKIAILIAAIPLFLLAIIAGLIDGLNQRAIRTANLGRESTYLFHKSIPVARHGLCITLWLWLSLPLALPPSVVFLSLSVLLGLIVSMSASRFKKYV